DVARELIGQVPASMSYECATIRVPRDWNAAAPGTGASPGTTAGGATPGGASPGGATPGAAPGGGETFDIALLRARSSRQRDRIGSLVVNPGGPGGSGVSLAVYLSASLPQEVLRRFDIVGFDPRGVGRSSAVECISDADLDTSFAYEPDPVSQADFDGLVALTGRIGAGCRAKYGDSLRLFSTEQAARDMDAVRAAVGDDKITYLGYSYGTLLGATYAQLFPRNIRAFVLDGAVDPRQGLIEGSESQAVGFERAFNSFVSWCRDRGSQCPIGPDARAAVTNALNAARRAPVRGRDGRPATAGWIVTAVVSSLYTQQGWTELASAMSRLGRGDASGVFTLADRYAERDSSGRYSNLFDANTAVNCADEEEKVSIARVRELQGQWRAKYPLFGAVLAVSLLTCAQWPGGRDPYPTGPASGAPPIVVVGTTGDPATPYEQTPKLAQMLGVGVVLTWQGEGHTAYPESRCIVQAVNAYLIEVEVPRAGLTCPAR
ncbi:MAG TPA: alpha/beta hydrolase, partial [Micromonosporaceae bacterium]|nr:alpha/beta hydrolase [Micromonosporaceae bacterium]